MTMFEGAPQIDDTEKYPMLSKYTRPLNVSGRQALGREDVVEKIKATLMRFEVTNAILLGPAGSGKTAVVEQFARETPEWDTYEVDLSLMSSGEGATDGAVEMASRMKRLTNEIVEYQQQEKKPIVLFMDEFHLIAQISPAALQAIKPMLAESGRRDVKIIAATTFEEFNDYIRKDEALTERLQRITLNPPKKDVVIQILKSMQQRYIPDVYVPDELYSQIVDYTDRFIPSAVQPRKSLLVFDSMLGHYRASNMPVDFKNLQKVMMDTYGVNISFDTDVDNLAEYLNGRVFNQDLAVKALIRKLYVSQVGLNDPTRPQGSFLFTGSTGTGKTEMAKALTTALFGSESAMIRFDMSEYSRADSVDSFQKRLSAQIWEHPYSVVLLDEIEKANPAASKLLLQVIDDARLADQHGRQVSFANCYIIMTTNVGQEIYKSLEAYLDDDDKDKTEDQKQETLNNGLSSYSRLIKGSLISDSTFPTELVNRLDAFIPFAPLERPTYVLMTTLRLSKLADEVYQKFGVRLTFKKKVMDYLTLEKADTSTDSGGGRGLQRIIDDEIVSNLAQFMLQHPKIKHITINVKGKMAFTDKQMLHGDAHIVVGRSVA